MNFTSCLFWAFTLEIIYGFIIEVIKNRVNKKHEKLVKLIYKKKCKEKIVRSLKIYDRLTNMAYHYTVFPSWLKKDLGVEQNLIILLIKKIKVPFGIWLYMFLIAILYWHLQGLPFIGSTHWYGQRLFFSGTIWKCPVTKVL